MISDRKTLVVIQSRLASARLPAKALLLLGGIPSVLLCARRAGNSGLNVVVATSDEEADNAIAALLAAEGVVCVRGPHEDVLKRFVLAIASLGDEDIVVRLTADNVFPDGEFIESLLYQFIDSNVDYLGTSSPLDGLPYGLSGEVFTAAVLRKANRTANSISDREHVTPWMRRHCSVALFALPEVQSTWSRLRCTLDSFDDYRSLMKVFEGVTDPYRISWRELASRLDAVAPNMGERCPFKVLADGGIHSELTLGTAQLGMAYGIANKIGMPSDQQSRELVQQAIESGVTTFDTARVYGGSETRLGRLLTPGYRDRVNIVTKLDVLSDLSDDASPALVKKLVDESVFHSCHSLRQNNIDTLLLHRWEHHDAWGGAAWERLIEHKNAGLIRRLGVSVYQPREAIAALKDSQISHIQAPINLLDWRWREREFLAAVHERPDVIWHARSVLLQGLLLLPPENWPRIPEVDPDWTSITLDNLVRKLNRKDRIDLCIAYARSLPWVTSLVIGMDDTSQLRDNLQRFRLPKLTTEQRLEVEAALPHFPVTLLNPALWKDFI